MQKKLLLLLAVFALVSSCGKDEIGSASDTGGSGSLVDIDTTGSGNLSLDSYERRVVVVFSPGGTATVTGDSAGISAQISGNGVTITNSSGSTVAYILTGSASDGYFKVYSDREQALALNGLSLTNPRGAAINIQGPSSQPGSGKTVKLLLNGSNTLADGPSYTATPTLEDEKAALFAEGGILLTGSGSLTVTATGKGAVTSDSYVHISGTPSIHASSTNGHGIRGKGYILIAGGTIDVQVSGNMKKGLASDTLVRFDGGQTTVHASGNSGYDTASLSYGGPAGIRAGLAFIMNNGSLNITVSGQGGKGINSNGSALFNGGSVDITVSGTDFTTATDTVSAKGLKFQGDITVSGGTVTSRCTHNEAVESKGNITITAGELYGYSSTSNAVNAKNHINIQGGYLCGHSDGNDGLDAGGDVTLTAGLLYAISTDGVHKAVNSGKGFVFSMNGGTMIAIGGLEKGADLAVSCRQTAGWRQGSWHTLAAGGAEYSFKAPGGGSGTLVVAGSGDLALTAGTTVSGGTSRFDATLIEGGSTEGGTAIPLTSYSSNK